MEVLPRRRLGKGIGANVQGNSLGTDLQTPSVGAANEGEPVDDAGRDLRELQGTEGIGDADASSSRAVVLGNPFWSQRAQEELQLQRARSDFLGSADDPSASRLSSSCTELRAANDNAELLRTPQGPPQVFGPAALRTTVDTGRDGGQAAVELLRNSNSSDQAAVSGVNVTASTEERHGLSSRERHILTQMKDAMVRLADQNSELLTQNEVLKDRISRLEDERSTSQAAWHSAESKHDVVDQHGFSPVMFSRLSRKEVGSTAMVRFIMK